MENYQIQNDISNIILQTTKQHKRKKQYFICCLCPDCKAIFTISIDEPSRRYGGIYSNCPVCKGRRDWCFYKISKNAFKFIRWWRTKETLSEWFIRHSIFAKMRTNKNTERR